MKKMTLALGAGLLTFVAAGGAFAQPAGMIGGQTMARADAEARAGAVFDRMDANRDGKLDQADRAARSAARFDRMDANHDGALSKAEFSAAHDRTAGAAEGRRMGAGGHAGMLHAGKGMIRGMDMNQDRAISRSEFVAGAMKRFDGADADHDGKLTPDERRGAMKARMGGMHRHGGGAMPPQR